MLFDALSTLVDVVPSSISLLCHPNLILMLLPFALLGTFIEKRYPTVDFRSKEGSTV